MDRPAAHGDGHRRPAAQLNERPRLERIVELGAPSLVVHEWPGKGRPVLHLADPLAPSSELAARLDTPCRVLSLQPRGDAPYQVHVADVVEVLQQFGFEHVDVVGEGLGCVVAVVLAAWHAGRVARLTLVDARYTPEGESHFARSLRDCPPDWPALRASIGCPIEERS